MNSLTDWVKPQRIFMKHTLLTDETKIIVKATEFNSVCAMIGVLIDYLISNAIFTPDQMQMLVNKAIASGMGGEV